LRSPAIIGLHGRSSLPGASPAELLRPWHDTRCGRRKIGVSPRTAEDYLNRIKKKYEDVGRPARTKLELAQRLREDGLEGEPRL
jgi:hypothetical protein